MPRLTKTHYRQARYLAVSASSNGQTRLRPDVFRDALDIRSDGDLTAKQLDLLVDHAKWRHPHCFTKGKDRAPQQTQDDQGPAQKICPTD